MSKFKNGMAAEFEEQLEKERQQKMLHEKHNIEDENVVVVEKSGIYRLLVSLCKTIAAVIVFCLAAVGLLSLVYPEPRNEMISILESAISQVIDFF